MYKLAPLVFKLDGRPMYLTDASGDYMAGWLLQSGLQIHWICETDNRITFWNRQSYHILSCDSLSSFKTHIKTFFYNKNYTDLNCHLWKWRFLYQTYSQISYPHIHQCIKSVTSFVELLYRSLKLPGLNQTLTLSIQTFLYLRLTDGYKKLGFKKCSHFKNPFIVTTDIPHQSPPCSQPNVSHNAFVRSISPTS